MLHIDFGDYRLLCSTLGELRKRFETQRSRIIALLDETARQKRRLQQILGKSKYLTRRLTVLQKKQLGLMREPGLYIPGGFCGNGTALIPEHISELALDSMQVPEFPENHKNMRELRAAELKVLTMIDKIKSRLLRLELLEMRINELMVSVNKALEAYECQWQIIRRSIYPLGIFSVIYKSMRQFFGASHFSPRDLKDIKFLGDLAGSIMKMADSPVI